MRACTARNSEGGRPRQKRRGWPTAPEITMTDQSNGNAIRYLGGKGLLYQRLISLIPPHTTYIEAFAGGGAVARNKLPALVNIAIDADTEALAN